DGVADHLLERGLQGLSLRPLAAALGTSDRMLLHYFRDKEELLGAALERVSTRLLEAMGTSPPKARPFGEVVAGLVGVLRGPGMRPYLRIWLDLAAMSAAGDSSFDGHASKIAGTFREWLLRSIDEPAPRRRELLAAVAMATLDGCALFDSLGLAETAEAAIEGLSLLANGPKR
ncbi:MAG: TetR/AcrR family transcriptional regulator, partial [Spirochaetaceae bacterium]|nr:TetR/AcrR family transcriptional regulator [Spirochaetaceae bacterium]